MGVKRLNYLTDDPWNPAFRSHWFFTALPLYDIVFSVRRANLPDLARQGCKVVEYVPFGFDPELSFPEPIDRSNEHASLASDILFVGGAERDRVSYMAALIRAGFQVAIYGDNWTNFPETRAHTRGHAAPATLRKATSVAKVALCLVRRANRDGHVMRTFETAAIGACMLTEDTAEHREIFGPEGEAVVYFRTIEEMIAKLRWLLDHSDERRRLAAAAHARIVGGRNTYQDRLITMLRLAGWDPETSEGSDVPALQHSGVPTP
jgi:spore maturation protein CgeB